VFLTNQITKIGTPAFPRIIGGDWRGCLLR